MQIKENLGKIMNINKNCFYIALIMILDQNCCFIYIIFMNHLTITEYYVNINRNFHIIAKTLKRFIYTYFIKYYEWRDINECHAAC